MLELIILILMIITAILIKKNYTLKKKILTFYETGKISKTDYASTFGDLPPKASTDLRNQFLKTNEQAAQELPTIQPVAAAADKPKVSNTIAKVVANPPDNISNTEIPLNDELQLNDKREEAKFKERENNNSESNVNSELNVNSESNVDSELPKVSSDGNEVKCSQPFPIIEILSSDTL